MPDLYNIAAQRGRIVGQGLMGLGQAVSTGLGKYKQAKLEAEEREERKKEQQLTKTLSLINIYTKMGDDLTPQDRMKLYTGALIPMLAKAGGLPEGTKQEDVSKFISSLAAQSKDAMKGFREDNNKLLNLVHEGKYKEADKFLSGMMTEYGRFPGAKSFLNHAKELLKEEKAYGKEQQKIKEEREYEEEQLGRERLYEEKKTKEERKWEEEREKARWKREEEKEKEKRAREIAKEQQKRTREMTDKIAGWIADKKVREVPKRGLMAGLSDTEKETIFSYGHKKLYIPDDSELSKPEMKESTAIEKMEAIKKGIDRYETTGGLSDTLLAAISAADPTIAEDIKGKPHDEAIEFMKKRYNYLFDNFVSQKNKDKYGLERFEEKKAVDWRNFK